MTDDRIYEMYQENPNISPFDFGLRVAKELDKEVLLDEITDKIHGIINDYRPLDLLTARDVYGVLECVKLELYKAESEDSE